MNGGLACVFSKPEEVKIELCFEFPEAGLFCGPDTKPCLPHYAVTTDDPNLVHVLARQPIDMVNPHPFIDAGNTEFNMFLWMPPLNDRPGDILLADSTIFTTLFGGDESLERFWRNLATC